MFETLCIFLPLVAALIAGLGNRRLGDRGAQIVTCLGVAASRRSIGIWLLYDIGYRHAPRAKYCPV